MASKFSPEVLEAMAEMAPLNLEKAEELAIRFNLKTRSVIAGAKRHGVAYQRKERVSKTGEPVVTKEDLVARVAQKFGVEVAELAGLEKATKDALKVLAG